MEQELAIAQRFIFEILDPVLFGDSLIGPPQQLLLIDNSQALNPIEFADLPDQTEHEGGLSVDDIDTANAHQLCLKLVAADIHHVVAILDDVDAGSGLVGVLLPVDEVGPQSVDHLQQNRAGSQVVNQVVHVDLLNTLGVYPVLEDPDLATLVGFGLGRQLNDLLLFDDQSVPCVEDLGEKQGVQSWISGGDV